MQATEPIFDPFAELLDAELECYRARYVSDFTLAEIRENVYGGEPLGTLYESITFRWTDSQIRRAEATIHLNPVRRAFRPSDPDAVLDPDPPAPEAPSLVMRKVDLRPFLVSAIPGSDYTGLNDEGWDGEDHWDDVDPQYRVDLCHSEISRWSVILKDGGQPLGKVEISGAEHFVRIELINNCTSTTGFELKLFTAAGRVFHGSFGRTGRLFRLYRLLSQARAGAMAWQQWPARKGPLGVEVEPILDPVAQTASTTFFGVYGLAATNRWDLEIKGPIGRAPSVDLVRYRTEPVGKATKRELRISRGRIQYARWGRNAEYYRKPLALGLFGGFETRDGTFQNTVPTTYRDIETASRLKFPNFTSEGLYAHHKPTERNRLRWLYEIDLVLDRRQGAVCRELSFHRTGGAGDSHEFRRMVLGNLQVEKIPVFPGYMTFHRFGFATRPTEMRHGDPNPWTPEPGEVRPPYAFLLGGTADEPDRYILPEAFGVERVILSFDAADRRDLVVDLIGFERIVPVWQGTVRLA